jgi:hypothetical protein
MTDSRLFLNLAKQAEQLTQHYDTPEKAYGH